MTYQLSVFDVRRRLSDVIGCNPVLEVSAVEISAQAVTAIEKTLIRTREITKDFKVAAVMLTLAKTTGHVQWRPTVWNTLK